MPIVETDIADDIATIRLNRPEVHNAFDDRMIADDGPKEFEHRQQKKI